MPTIESLDRVFAECQERKYAYELHSIALTIALLTRYCRDAGNGFARSCCAIQTTLLARR